MNQIRRTLPQIKTLLKAGFEVKAFGMVRNARNKKVARVTALPITKCGGTAFHAGTTRFNLVIGDKLVVTASR